MRHFKFTILSSKRFRFEKELDNNPRSDNFHYGVNNNEDAIIKDGNEVVIPANSLTAAKRKMRKFNMPTV